LPVPPAAPAPVAPVSSAAPTPVAPAKAAPPPAEDLIEDEAEDELADLSEVTVSTAAAAMALRAGGAGEPTNTPVSAPQSAPEPAPPAEPDDLDAVPGLGPGLLWVLREAGVRNVAALRAADPEALADRLGVVGRLIDVAGLQRLASEVSAGSVR
jgi:predicted flap endonuclease-1-like 5' DNA nuclease